MRQLTKRQLHQTRRLFLCTIDVTFIPLGITQPGLTSGQLISASTLESESLKPLWRALHRPGVVDQPG